MSKKYQVYIGIEGQDESKIKTSEDDCWNEEEVVLEIFDNLADAMALVGLCQQIKQLQTELEKLKNDGIVRMKKLCADILSLKSKNRKLQAELSKHRWIPVSERLPKTVRTVWILLYSRATNSFVPSMGFYGEKENGWGWEILGPGILSEVAYWMEPIELKLKAEQRRYLITCTCGRNEYMLPSQTLCDICIRSKK